MPSVITVRPAAPARPRGRRAVRRAGLIALVAVLAVVMCLSVAVGSQHVPVPTVLRIVFAPDGSAESALIHDLRVPRTLLGLVVGAALGASGALMQVLTRNPLADPGLLGVNYGASFAVVCSIAFLGVTSVGGYIWFAFAGAAIAACAVYALGAAGGGSPARLALAGVAVSASLGAATNGFLSLNGTVFDQMRFWDVGALAGREFEVFWPVLPFLLAGAVIAVALGPSLNALALGDDAGTGLGTRVNLVRLLGAVSIVLLCGAATAAIGPVTFVGLTVAHIARAITGPDNRWVIAYSMVLGPVLLLASDVLGRVLVRPAELQVGIVTAFLGAPVFIALIRRDKIAKL
nr:iron chelate uptake ABC transporter family permease subunit [Bailinhaonella thermotolerans]